MGDSFEIILSGVLGYRCESCWTGMEIYKSDTWKRNPKVPLKCGLNMSTEMEQNRNRDYDMNNKNFEKTT